MAGHGQQAHCPMKLLGPNPMASHGWPWGLGHWSDLAKNHLPAMAGHGRQARCLMKLPGPNPIWPAMAGAGSSRVIGSSHALAQVMLAQFGSSHALAQVMLAQFGSRHVARVMSVQGMLWPALSAA